ncbi:MAG: TetR/AcrR family transcriptional regulator [Kibdelosporangium sp.]
MGNREDLLAGAEQCLYEKGYARTTSRDIATAAGVSLAAIGYHFGSKEALLNAALRRALEKWGDDLEAAMTDGAPAEKFEAAWSRVVASFPATNPLWSIQFELLSQLRQNAGFREMFAGTNHDARQGLLELFGRPAEHTEAAGAVYQALLIGLAAMWLADPESTPSGPEILNGIRAIAGFRP